MYCLAVLFCNLCCSYIILVLAFCITLLVHFVCVCVFVCVILYVCVRDVALQQGRTAIANFLEVKFINQIEVIWKRVNLEEIKSK